MDATQIGGIPLNTSTMIRLVVVVILAIVVRHLVMRLGTKAMNSRRDKNHNGGNKPRL
jgi:hypothetical protein